MNPVLRAIEGDIMGIKRRLRAARVAFVPRAEMMEDEQRLRTLKDQARALRAKLERTDDTDRNCISSGMAGGLARDPRA